MTVLEISAYLRVDRSTVYRLVKRGQIPYFCVGKKTYRFSRKEITEWLASGGGGWPLKKKQQAV
jgi:excisionase family DNA binding protein